MARHLHGHICVLPPPPPNITPGRDGRCSYCQSPLDQRYYFCARCATPYQSAEQVLPPPTPVQLTDAQRVRRKAPHVHVLFWTYVAVIAGGTVLAILLYPARPDLQLLLQVTLIGGVTLYFAIRHWRSLAPQFARTGLNSPATWIGLGLLGPMLLLNFLYHGMLVRAGAIVDGPAMVGGQLMGEAPIALALAVLLFAVFPAVTEEIAFRGLLQHWLASAIRPLRALVIASALFAFVHFSLLSLPYLFAVGMLLGWTKWRTGSLWPAIFLHFLHNFIVVVFMAGAV